MSLFLDFAKKIEKLRAEVDMPKELAEQYQEMVELVRNNKIENFSLQMDNFLTFRKTKKEHRAPFSALSCEIYLRISIFVPSVK